MPSAALCMKADDLHRKVLLVGVNKLMLKTKYG